MTTQPIKLCYIEDEQQHRDAVGKHLSELGYDITLYADGASALAHLEQLAPDVILVDILMPGMNGLEVIKKIREIGIDTPIIVLTNYEKNDLDRVTLDEMKVASVLLKSNTSLDALSDAVKEAAGKPAES